MLKFKRFFSPQSFLSALPQPSLPGADGDGNPYLSGSKLHLTAKKGMGFF